MNEIEDIKGDGSPFKVFTPYWRSAEKFYLEKFHQEKKIIKSKKKISFLKDTINEKFSKKNWLKNLKNIGNHLRKIL